MGHLAGVRILLSVFTVITCTQTLIVYCADPCKTYLTFSELEKRSINYTVDPNEVSLSDKFTGSGYDWYGAEGYHIVTRPPAALEGHCGTTYPIWIKDALPDVVGEEKTVKACLVDIGDECFKSVDVRALNCGNLLIYQLKPPPVFEASYCVDLTDPNKPMSTYAVRPRVDWKIITDEKKLDHFIFICNFVKSDSNLRYTVQWFVNGGLITSFPAAEWTEGFFDETALTEDILIRNGYKSPGFDLQCTVKSSFGEGFPAGRGILSETKFFGISLPPGPITVHEGEEKSISIHLTAPLGCAGRQRGCRLDVFTLTRDKPESCEPSALIDSKCGVTFRSNWKEPRTLKIKGKVTPGYNSKETWMKIFFSTNENVPTHPYWSNYDIGSVTVITKKDQAKQTQVFCYANQDPHMKTYDGRLYEFHHDGVFILYKHKTLEIEVQMKLQPCSRTTDARCPCGLAVRAGKTIFRVDSCRGTPARIGYASCIDGKDLLTVLKSGCSYKIYLPTGSRVDFRLSPNSKFFNIALHPSIEDFDKVLGLCGTFNQNPDDDVVGDMSHKWRAKLDLFNDNDFIRFQRWQSSFGLCVCDVLEKQPSSLEASMTCSATDKDICLFDHKFKPLPTANRVCAIETGRRRRSLLNARIDRFKRDVGSIANKTWTNEEATSFCESFFNASKAAGLCRNIDGMTNIVEDNKKNCVLDILATESTTFAIQALESSKSLCMNEVELNSTMKEETVPGVPSIYEALKEITCENECSGKGTCLNGTCKCESGYASSDCSRDVSVPPVIMGMDLDGHCDVATEICNETTIIGDYFDENGQIRCRFVPFTIYSNKSESTDPAEESTPLVESFSEAICILPKPRHKRSTRDVANDVKMASGYRISIANYGEVFSEERILVLYNSQCQSCNVTESSVTCKFTSKSCITGQLCVKHGETHPENSCYVCDATSATRRWSLKGEAPCTPPRGKLWIIGAVVGGLLIAVCVVGLIYYFVKKLKRRKKDDYHLRSHPSSMLGPKS